MKLAFVVLIASLLCVGEVMAQTSTATGNASAAAGNATAISGAGNTQVLMLQGGEIPKLLPQPGTAPVSVPQLFQVMTNQGGLPAELIGAPLDDVYLSLCEPSSAAGELPLLQGTGRSGKTKYSFASHQNAGWMKMGEQTPVVKVNYTGNDTIRCMGVLLIQVTPEAVKDGYPIGISALATDAMNTMADVLRGLPELVLVSERSFWGGSLGLSAQGAGKNAGAGFNFGFATTAGVSSVDGSNTPVTRMSMSFIVGVRVPAGDQYAVRISLRPAAAQTSETSSNSAKKSQVQ